MTKVAIKNENITSFGGIYHIMDVFSKLGFEKLTESVLGKRGSCLLYTSDAADEEDSVDLGGRRIIRKSKVFNFCAVLKLYDLSEVSLL